MLNKLLLPVLLVLLVVNAQVSAQISFTNIAGAGVDASNVAYDKDGGCSFADYDLDGDLDLVVNTDDNNSARRSFLLRNDNGVFTDVTNAVAPGLKSTERTSRTAAWGDCNNDGYPDLITNNHYRLKILINNAGASFTLHTDISAMTDGINTEGLGWLDYDNDGDLDYFVENDSHGVDLFQNDGAANPTFTQVTIDAVGAAGTGSGGLGLPQGGSSDGDYATSVDLNNDGYVDIIARRRNDGTNDGQDNNPYDIFLNDGDGTFTPNTVFNEWGNNNDKGAVLSGDFDNDGDFDILWTSGTTDAGRTVIYNNVGNNSMNFVIVANPFKTENGAAETATNFEGAAMGDVDNDGDIDVFLTQEIAGPGRLYLNNSSGQGLFDFRQAGPSWIPGAATNYGINVNGDGQGCVFADYDNDGDLDLYVNRDNASQLWQNDYIGSATETAATYQNNYLRVITRVDLGGGVEREAINATVRFLDCDGNVLGGIREIGSGGAGHGSQTSPWLHFGLPNGPSASYLIEVQFTRNGTTPVIVQKAVIPDQLVPISPGASTMQLAQTVIILDTDANDITQCPEDCVNGIDDDGDGLVDCDDPECHLNGTGYNWYFGQNAALSFENGSGPVQISPSSMNAEEGCAAWSSPSGDLMFYTNGVNAYDRHHNIMPNGTTLGGHPSGTQSGVILEDPANADRFYVFGNNNGGTEVRFSIIDMTLNGGLGDVVVGRKNILLQATQGEKLAAWPHANGTDYWVIVVNQNNLFAHQITASGPTGPVTTAVPSFGRTYGQMKFGPDGTHLAMACYPSSFGNYRVQVLDFDNATGAFSDLREWALEEPYGVEFSPDGRLLYATDMGWGSYPGRLMQYVIDGNATGADILASQTILLSSNYLHSALQAGPDGKLYMATSMPGNNPRNGLAVINSPNTIGAGANAVADQITFTGGAMSRSGLPNFPYYQIQGEPVASYVVPGDSCLPSAEFEAFASGATSYQWLLNGSPIAGANSSTYTPTVNGTYQAVAYFVCGSDTSEVIIMSDEPPTISCPADITVDVDEGICGAVVDYAVPIGTDDCSGQTTTLTAGQGPGTLFPEGTTTVTYTVTDGAGQQASCSFDITVNPGNDNDSDGICDSGDLDDDNDGIPDSEEGCGELIKNGSFENDDFTDATAYPNGFTAANGTFIGTTFNANTVTGWEYDLNLDGWVGGVPMWSGNFANAIHGSQFMDIIGSTSYTSGVTTKMWQDINTTPGLTYRLSFYWGEDVGHSAGEDVDIIAKAIDANNVELLTAQPAIVADGFMNGIYGPKRWTHFTATFTATTSATTILFSTSQPAGNAGAGAALDLVSVTLDSPSDCADTDNDGVPDVFDLDSDNDGIYDVVESGSGQPHTNGVLNGAVTTEGIPVVVDADANGLVDYTIADSDSDGNIDSIELDSDGDLCEDVLEAGYTDANGDGELGPVPLTVNGDGVVTSGGP